MEESEEMESVHCIARSYFPVQKYNFKWIVEGFFKMEYETRSPDFYPETGNPWWLEMQKHSNFIYHITLYRSGGKGSAFVEVNFRATDCKGEVFHTSIISCDFPNTTKCIVVLERKNVNLGKDKLLSKDVLEFSVQLKIYNTDICKHNISTQYCFPSKELFLKDVRESISDDLGKFYESHLNSDVSLSVEGETVQVHKAILSARSPVFAKMFQNEMIEATKNVIVIKDIKLSAMKEVIGFMYGQFNCDYDYDTAVEIYYAAAKYDVKKLQEVCGAILTSQMNEKNAGYVWDLADRHHDDMLMKETMKFITANIKSCVKSEWWGDLMSTRSVLAAELVAYIADIKP